MGEKLGERFANPIPTRELERRWALVRKAIKEQGIDCLIMENDDQFLSGYVRYFTDVVANVYKTVVLFPADEEMTVINHGAVAGPPAPPIWASRGIKQSLTSPYVQALNYTNTYAAQDVVKVCKAGNYKKVGWVGLGFISAKLYQYVMENLPGVEFVDATDMVDEIKAVKGPDEIAGLRKAVALHDYLAEAMESIFRPGIYEHQVRSELMKACLDLGSEEQNILIGTDPVSARMSPSFFQNRKIELGDKMVCLIEVNGAGGFWGELARLWVLDEPSQQLADAFETAKKAQHLVASMMKPGANPADLFKANNELLVSKGYAPETRLFAHGQGYDMVERPAFVPAETMKLKENMFLAVHPGAANKDVFAFCCDNYLITADGAEMLNKYPQQIILC